MSYAESQIAFGKVAESAGISPSEWNSSSSKDGHGKLLNTYLEILSVNGVSAETLDRIRKEMSQEILGYWYRRAQAFEEQPYSGISYNERGQTWLRYKDDDYAMSYMEIEGPVDVKVLTIERKGRLPGIDKVMERDVFTITREQEDDSLYELGHPVTVQSEIYNTDGETIRKYEVKFRKGLVASFICTDHLYERGYPAVKKETKYTFQ